MNQRLVPIVAYSSAAPRTGLSPWLRWAVIASATLILCSCRSADQGGLFGSHRAAPAECNSSDCATTNNSACNNSIAPQPVRGPFAPRVAMPAMPGPAMPPTVNCGPPLPQCVFDASGGAGEVRLVHEEEYLHDGGDQGAPVVVASDYSVRGLGIEDTVAHYDCHDGQTLVEPSNPVCIYAPRFLSVRKVEAAYSNNQFDQLVGVDLPLKPTLSDERQKANAAMQPLQPVADIADKKAVAFRERLKGEGLDLLVRPFSLQDALLPYEDFAIVRVGIYQQDEKPRLAKSIQAAIAWTRVQAVQVEIEKQRAVVQQGDQRAEAVYQVDLPGCPKLRVCKVASTNNALPGEEVDFTIRFDNVGLSTAKNVVLYDNLTTRLAYVPDSAQASRPAHFYSQENEADSLVLKWTLDQPLEPGQGGVVRFRCKVR